MNKLEKLRLVNKTLKAIDETLLARMNEAQNSDFKWVLFNHVEFLELINSLNSEDFPSEFGSALLELDRATFKAHYGTPVLVCPVEAIGDCIRRLRVALHKFMPDIFTGTYRDGLIAAVNAFRSCTTMEDVRQIISSLERL